MDECQGQMAGQVGTQPHPLDPFLGTKSGGLDAQVRQIVREEMAQADKARKSMADIAQAMGVVHDKQPQSFRQRLEGAIRVAMDSGIGNATELVRLYREIYGVPPA